MTSQRVGDFRILRQLGRGGMGAVYEAVRDDTGESVAIKVLLASLTAEAALRQRFASEINTLKHLRHPNIVKLHGFGNDQGNPYYVMELVDGNSLAQELNLRQHFEWIEVAKIGLDLALALKYASDRGIIHRDLKPSNIMLDRKAGIVKLSDFGIAHCFTADRMSDLQSVIGTLEYMAPEQALGRPVGHRADLYSLGAVLYVLLSGKPPHAGKTLTDIRRKHREESILPLREVSRQKDVPEELTFLIEELLKFEPNQRPVNAQLVSRRLQATLRALIGDPAKILLTVAAAIQPNKPNAKPTITLDSAVSVPPSCEPTHHTSHFVVVREEELGIDDEAPKVFRPLVVAKIIAMIVALAGLIAGAVFLLHPQIALIQTPTTTPSTSSTKLTVGERLRRLEERMAQQEQVLESVRQQLLASERFGATIERETAHTPPSPSD